MSPAGHILLAIVHGFIMHCSNRCFYTQSMRGLEMRRDECVIGIDVVAHESSLGEWCRAALRRSMR